MKKGHIDRPFLLTVIILVVLGFFIFSSASLGLLARGGVQFSAVAVNQLMGIGIGAVLMFILAKTPYKIWRKYSFYIFIASVVATLLVFIPGLGFEFNGARRWLSIGGFSIQPAELLKIGVVLYFAALLTNMKQGIKTYREGLLPFLGLLAVVAIILLMQPDTGTFLVIAVTMGAMYMAAGARIRDLAIVGGLGMLAVSLLVYTRPYVKDRFLSFLDPTADPLGSGYQLQQSLIAVGSGEWIGRGFGQSIQKFNFLPEPIGDSIFSVFAEEFGFIGGVILIGLFLFFAYRGLTIASKQSDLYGGLVCMGIVILITSQSFINIASLIGVMPLTGLPLLFISHGGTALMLALAEVGIVLNISKHIKS